MVERLPVKLGFRHGRVDMGFLVAAKMKILARESGETE